MSRPQVSVQLYSVREHLSLDLNLTLEKLSRLGFSVGEPFGLPSEASRLKKALSECGLTAPTAHASVLDNPSAAVDAALELGTTLLIDPYQPESFFKSRSELSRLADQLSAAAQVGLAHGVSIGYHNHDHEIRNEIDGVPALVALAAETDPTVLFEVDLFWCEQAGTNPLEIIESLKGRVPAMHAKDAPRGAGVSGQVPLGQGAVRLLPSIASEPDARIVIEFDQYSGDLFEAIGQSLEFLRQNGVHA